MAILKGKNDDGFRGRIGDYIVYESNGQVLKRRAGVSTNQFSDKQLACQQVTRIVAVLLKPIKEFIQIGFNTEAIRERKSSYNLACSYNRLNAIKGIYPDQVIDFSKVLVSKGKMAIVEGAKATLVASGLEFTWNSAINGPGTKASDQVMLLAYFPDKKFAVYEAGGTTRSKGLEQLILPSSKKPVRVETYLAFISVDHKSVSNSFYTGQLIWNPLA